MFNASSCVDCHQQGGVGGGGPTDANVTVYNLAKPHPRGLPQSGVVHQHATASVFQETLRQVHAALPAQASLPLSASLRLTDVSITQRNTPPLFGDGQIDAITNDDIIGNQRKSAAARALRLDRAGRSEIGAGGPARRRPDRPVWLEARVRQPGRFRQGGLRQRTGAVQPRTPQATPLGRPDHKSQGIDLTDNQCGLMADFIRSLPPPIQALPTDPRVAEELGPVDCSLRRSAVSIVIRSRWGRPGACIQTCSCTTWGAGSRGRRGTRPAHSTRGRPTAIRGSEPPSPGEWRTAPLWGVADSGPYLHDGRAPSLERAIELHGGEASGVSARFKCPLTDGEAFDHCISQHPQGPEGRPGRAKHCLAVI